MQFGFEAKYGRDRYSARRDHNQHDHVLAHRTSSRAAVRALRRLGHLRDNTQCLTLAAEEDLAIEGKLGNSEVGAERTPNNDQTDAA